MAEDRIDSIIDIASVEAEFIKVEKSLSEMATTIKTFPKAQIFYDASGTKDLATANKQLSTVMDQLKVKNLELTNSIKEQQLAEKQAAAQRKEAAAAQKEADRQASIAAKQRIADEKAAAAAAQIAGAEKIKALQAQAKAEEELAAAQKERASTDIGTFDIAQGSGQKGGAKLTNTSKVTEQVFSPANQQEGLLLNLAQTEALLKQNKAAQKDLNDQLEQGTISQAKYDAAIVSAKQEEIAYKANISATNAELKARQTLNDSASGTIIAAKAQNKLLTTQRDAIPVGENATPEDLERLKAINAEIDKNNDLIDKNSDLLAKQKINIGNYPTNAFSQTFKTLNSELEQVQGKLVSGNFKGAELDQLTAKFNVLTNATKLTGQSFSSTGAQSKAFTEAGIQIGQVYGKNSDFFKQFADGVKNGQTTIKGFANEVTGVATKGKGFMGFLSQAYNGIRKLAYAIPGIGIGGIILLLLGPLQAAGEALVKWSNQATKSGRDFQDLEDHIKNTNAVVDKSADSFAQATAQVGKLTEDVQLAKQGFLDKNKVLKEYNDTMGKTTGQLKDFDQLEAKIVDDGPDYINLLFLKAKATAAYALAGEAARKALTAQQDAEKDFGVTDFLATNKVNILKQAFGFGDAADAGKNAADQVKKNADIIKKQQEKAFADLQKQADDFEKQAAELAKKRGWNFFDPDKINKGNKDAENLLDEFRKKTLKEQQEYIQALNQAELNQYKTMADDQEQSLTERLASEKKYYEKSLGMAQQNVKDQIDAVNLESDIAEKKAGKITDPQKKADTIIQIEKYRTEAIKKISEEGDAATLKINQDYYTQNVTIANQAFDKIKAKAEEAAKFIQEQQKIAFQNQKDTVDIDKDNQLLKLDKDFQDGKIKDLDEYNQKKNAIETAADIKQKQLDLKRIQEAETIFEALYGVDNLNLIKQAKDLEVQIEEEGNKKIHESEKELVDKKRELRDQLEQTFQDIIEGSFDNQQQKNEAETKSIEDKSQKEIDAINASGLAQTEKDKRVMAIQKQADFQTQQIEKRQQQQDLARAKFERAMSIVRIIQNTAEAVSKAVAEFPLTGGMPFVAIDLAIGAAQIASVLAQPLPQFKKGTKNAPRGKAIVGEEGSELIIDRAGKMFVTPPRPTLIELAGGEQVFKHNITEDFLKHHNLLTILQKAQVQKQPVKIEDDLARKTLRVLQNIEKKQGITIINNMPIESTSYYQRNIKN